MINVSDGIAMLELPSPGGGAVHPTLLWDGQQVILVDVGFPGQLEQIRAEMDSAGVPFQRLGEVILTHHDLDHIGGLASLRAAQPKLHVRSSALEKPYIQGDQTPSKLALMEANHAQLNPEQLANYERMKRGFQQSVAPVDETLADGQALPILGGLRVIATPGHTPGHICLYLPMHKLLIAGDALRVENGRLERMLPAMNADQPGSVAALQRLMDLDVETVICYHGGLFHGPAAPRIAELAQG